MSDDLCALTIAEAAAAYGAGTLTPTRLVRAYLERIERVDGATHAYVHVCRDAALAAAVRAEAEMARGSSRGPLHGIPLAVKDIIATAGVPTTANSRLLAGHVPQADATVWARLAHAGAILLGKAETQEFAIGGPAPDALYPPPRNPWNLACYTGGSSGGSGAAVAASLCSAALGTDTNGSVRMPAARCGIVGLKPTYGRVSRRGIYPLAFTLDTCGPMARSVADCALMLEVMAGHDPADAASRPVPVPRYREALSPDLAGVRIGVVRHFTTADATAAPAVNEAFDVAVAVLADRGASLRDVRMANVWDYTAVGMVITMAEAWAIHGHDLTTRPEAFNSYSRARFMLGAFVGGGDYVEAQRFRRELAVDYARLMADLDVVVSPSLLFTDWQMSAVGKLYYLQQPMPTTPFSVLGAPAITVPCGFADGDLPIGLQIAAKPFDEMAVLRVGHAYEQATPWHSRRPPL